MGITLCAAQSALLREDAYVTQVFQGCTAEPEPVLLQQAALAMKSRGIYSWIQLKNRARNSPRRISLLSIAST